MEKKFDSELSSLPSLSSSKLTSDISDSDSLTSISFVFDSTHSQKSTQTDAEFLRDLSDNERKNECDKSDMSTESDYSLIESPNFSPYHATSFCGDHSNVTNDFLEHPQSVANPDNSRKRKLNNRKRAIVMRRSSARGIAGDMEQVIKTSCERYSSWISGSTSEPIFEESVSELDLEKFTESGASIHIHSTPNSEMHSAENNQDYNKQEISGEILQECFSSPGSSTAKICYDTPGSPVIHSCRKVKTASVYETKTAFSQKALKVSFGSRPLASLRCAEEHSEKKLITKNILHGRYAQLKADAKHADCMKSEGMLDTVLTEKGLLVCTTCSVACTPQGPSIEVDKVVNSIVLTKRRLASSNISGSKVKQICSWNSIDDETCNNPVSTSDISKDVHDSVWNPTEPDLIKRKTKNEQIDMVGVNNEGYNHLFQDNAYFVKKLCDTTDCSNDVKMSRSFPCMTNHKNEKISEYTLAPKLQDDYYSFPLLTPESSYLQHLRKCGKLSPVIENILEKYSIDINQLTKDINSVPQVPMSNIDPRSEVVRNTSANNNIDSQHSRSKDECKRMDDAHPPYISCKKSSQKFSFFSKNAIVERSKSIGATNKALKHSSKSVMSASAVTDRDHLGATGGYGQHLLYSTSSSLRPIRQRDADTTEDEYEPGVLEEFEIPKRKSSFKDKLKGFRFKSDRRNDAMFSEDDLSWEDKVGRRTRSMNRATGKEVNRESSQIVAKTREDSNYAGDDEDHVSGMKIGMTRLEKAAVDRYFDDNHKTMKSGEIKVGSRSAVEIRPKQCQPSHLLVDELKDDCQQSSNEQIELVKDTSSHSTVIPLCSKTKIHFEDTVYYYPYQQMDDERQGALVTVSEGKVLKHGDGSEMKLVAKEVSSQMSGKPLHRQKSILHRMKAFFGRSSSSKDAIENPMYSESFGDKAAETNKKFESEIIFEDGAIGGNNGILRSPTGTADFVPTNVFGDASVVDDEYKTSSESGLNK